MAREYILSCDRCNKKGTERKPILTCTVRRSDEWRFTSDLCPDCWSGLQAEYGFRDLERTTRQAYEVVNFADIKRLS